MTEPAPTVILAGGSVRAAAGSALRAGLRPWCVDLFADTDLRAMAPTVRIPAADYPNRLPEHLRDAPPGPLIYTGGLENHPNVVEQIARDRPIWGNTGEALTRARDPFHVASLLQDANLPTAAVARTSDPNRKMLLKPLRGAGGVHINFAAAGHDAPPGYYLQELLSGPSFGAVFCAFPGGIHLLGVTEQIIGEPWLNAQPFQYAGSVGPIAVADPLRRTLLKLGETLRLGCGLRGLFGIDYVLHDGRPYLVDVNPRYTASVEIIERATGIAALAWHRSAFVGGGNDSARAAGTEIQGKAIVYAPRSLTFRHPEPPGDIADVPAEGETIDAGWPILTVFARGTSEPECRNELKRSTERVMAIVIACSSRPE